VLIGAKIKKKKTFSTRSLSSETDTIYASSICPTSTYLTNPTPVFKPCVVMKPVSHLDMDFINSSFSKTLYRK